MSDESAIEVKEGLTAEAVGICQPVACIPRLYDVPRCIREPEQLWSTRGARRWPSKI